MRFIVDHQLPPSLARWLIARGHEAEHVWAIGMDGADDSDIWDRALQLAAVIVTKDADFAERRGWAREGPVVVWLRVGNTATGALLAWLEQRWQGIETAIGGGVAVIEVR